MKSKDLNLLLASNLLYKKLMPWNVQNVKVYYFVIRIKVYPAKKYSVLLVFRKESVSVSVLNAIVSGNRKIFYIIGSANQIYVPV